VLVIPEKGRVHSYEEIGEKRRLILAILMRIISSVVCRLLGGAGKSDRYSIRKGKIFPNGPSWLKIY